MSLDKYLQSLTRLKLRPNDVKYFPKWLKAYAATAPVASRVSPVGEIPVQSDLVIGFLQGLRDNGSPAWQRLQALRAVESYQSAVLHDTTVDLGPIRQKLIQIDAREQRTRHAPQDYDPNLVAGEGNAGTLDESEPEPIRRMRAKLRLLHHPKSTEDAYLGQVKKFIRHLDDTHLERYGETEIADFLTDLAVTQQVAAGTQNAKRGQVHLGSFLEQLTLHNPQ